MCMKHDLYSTMNLLLHGGLERLSRAWHTGSMDSVRNDLLEVPVCEMSSCDHTHTAGSKKHPAIPDAKRDASPKVQGT